MKFALVLLAVIGLASATPIQPRAASTYTLRDDLNDFLALIPVDKLKAIVEEAMQDPENAAIYEEIKAYVHGEEFAAVAHIIAHNDQIQDLVNYLENEGLHVKELLNKLADRLGLPHWPARSSYSGSFNTYSFDEVLDKIVAVLPLDEIIALTLDKLANSESFQNLYMKVASMDGQKLHDDALKHPEIVSLVEKLNKLGVDTKKIWGLLEMIFGWGNSKARSATTYTLRDDLNDYLALLPMDKLIALHEKAKQDPESLAIRTRIVEYMHSEEFAAIAHIVAHNEQIQDLVNYIEGEGLHIIEVLNLLADRLGLPNWPTSIRAYNPSALRSSTRSFQSILDEFMEIMPFDEIIALTLDKLANSESFQNLYMKIASMDGQKLHDDALKHPEIVSLVEKLNNLGVDTKKIWGILQTIFGWGSYKARFAATYTLRDDINDYLALLPMDKLIALHEKAKQDPESLAIRTRIVEYMHSEEFAAIAHIVAHNDQIQDLVNYIEGEGLHIIEVLNLLADRLGLPNWPTSFRAYNPSALRSSTRSFQSILDEFMEIMPFDEIIALTLDKLANSESFQNLYMKIASMDGQKLHDDALKHPEIVSLVEKLNNLGVDTKKIWGILQTIFGWGSYKARFAATYTLRDDINDYLALLPMDKLIALHEKAQQDPESIAIHDRIVAYVHSEEFAAIAHIVAHNDQIQDLVNYIEGEGLHIIEVLNVLADRLGLPHWPSSFSAYSRSSLRSSTRSFQSILDEFMEIMPFDDIIALTLDKLANSESFQNLYMKIASMDGQKLHDDALTHPEIVSLVERLNNLGVDTKKIWGILQTIFGW